jgi:hypothetical protein
MDETDFPIWIFILQAVKNLSFASYRAYTIKNYLPPFPI